MTDTPLHRRFLAALGIPPTALADNRHHQTTQPDPGAGSYAYDALGVTFFTAIGAGDWNRQQYVYEQPYIIEPFRVATFGLGGISMGTDITTALLISQADAVARGLGPPKAPVAGGGTLARAPE